VQADSVGEGVEQPEVDKTKREVFAWGKPKRVAQISLRAKEGLKSIQQSSTQNRSGILVAKEWE
jgi:hypothetical protein